ncbi:MAG TPA: aminotransferase class III-fold pyridoxal phosphate-dependent enzyme, partial [Hanamia sp.]|nr:aminotransferase class III-fold pyridoxal phosphate-dependent enzyme [Hanamia sp.]
FTNNPVLGHINTFGGHPVCCAAGRAAMEFLLEEKIVENVFEKEKLFLQNLHSSKIKNVRSRGLMFALEFENFEENKKVIDTLIENGVFTDWFLFAPQCLRLVPPLTISKEEIEKACHIINRIVTEL